MVHNLSSSTNPPNRRSLHCSPTDRYPNALRDGPPQGPSYSLPTHYTPILHTISPNPTLIPAFPKTRYYGSKRRLLSWLYSELDTIDFTSVLDVFGGTACVSQLFRLMQKKVTYHDAFQFNLDVARTVLSDTLALSPGSLTSYLDSIRPCTGVVTRNFRDVFFLHQENLWIDGFMRGLDPSCFTGNQISLLKYLVYQACLKKRPFNIFHRANLTLRTNASVTRSFGNSTTWGKPFSEHITLAYQDLAPSRFHSKHDVSILCPSNASAIDGEYDLVYIDPPYVSRRESYNRDDYWRRYHFLEGLSIYESWEARLDSTSDIKMMPTPGHFVAWSRKASFREQLFQFIELHSRSIVALSYVDNGYPSCDEIQSFLDDTFGKVLLKYLNLNHALSRERRRECLWIGFPR